MMIKTIILIFLFLLLVLPGFSVSAKPQPSLQMKMTWVDGLVYDQVVKIQLEVSSQLSSEAVNVNFRFPDGVTLQQGSATSIQKVEKGQSLILEYLVLIEKNSKGSIKAEATIGDTSHIFFRANSQLSIESSSILQKAGARTPNQPDFTNSERNGIKLREYQIP